KEVSGKTVSENMRGDVTDAGIISVHYHQSPEGLPGDWATPFRYEQCGGGLIACQQSRAYRIVLSGPLYRVHPKGNRAFFPTFSKDGQESEIQVDVGNPESHQLRDPETCGIEPLKHRFVSQY